MFAFLLDLLLPQKPLVRELLAMNAQEFAERAGRCEGPVGKEIISIFDYRDPIVKEAIWMLKYRGNRKIAALLAAILYDELLAFLAEYSPLTNFDNPLLAPIPLSKKRERERGFNQCKILTDELMRLDFVSSSSSPQSEGELWNSHRLKWDGVNTTGRNFTLCLNGLRKIKDTPSQTKQDTRAKRLENLDGCFSADANAVKGRNIILIDDVATTGATIEEARRTLRHADARKVIAFTIAH